MIGSVFIPDSPLVPTKVKKTKVKWTAKNGIARSVRSFIRASKRRVQCVAHPGTLCCCLLPMLQHLRLRDTRPRLQRPRHIPPGLLRLRCQTEMPRARLRGVTAPRGVGKRGQSAAAAVRPRTGPLTDRHVKPSCLHARPVMIRTMTGHRQQESMTHRWRKPSVDSSMPCAPRPVACGISDDCDIYHRQYCSHNSR